MNLVKILESLQFLSLVQATTQSAFVESNDVGVSTFPRGGMIVSVGSQAGLGYQPLVAAGGTALVSAAGTITSVSIGNSGSGYESGIQTNVSVGVRLPDVAGTTIIPVGIASVSDGHVTSVAITTDRVFYAPKDISNVEYSHTTGLTTVTTSTAHGLSVMKLSFLELHLHVITLVLVQSILLMPL